MPITIVEKAKAQPARRKPSMARDVGRSFVGGVSGSIAEMADTVWGQGPVGTMLGGLQTAAKTANLFSAAPPPTLSMSERPLATEVARTTPKPQTLPGEYARTLGQMTPNLLAPGSAGARVANWIIPALTSEAAGQIARNYGANETGEAIARGVGAVGGAGIASLRPQHLFDRRPASPVDRLGQRTRQDPAAMSARAAEYRANGVEPTLVDVLDDAGRGGVRAAANRQTPGRQVANDYSRNRTADLPSRISSQTRRTVSADARTPDEIRAATVAQRTQRADAAFRAVRGDQVQLAPEGVQALRTDYGRAAIREAARRERDPATRAALNRLAEDALDAPSTPITIGMADRVSRVLLGQAGKAARGGDDDLASTLGGLGRSIRSPTAQASPGYARALKDYAADSRLTEAAGVGEGLMVRNTDEFTAAARALGPQERELALAAARRAVERSSGENPSTAAGFARRLADAPEQQTRNAALMGPDRANRFQGAMRAEAQAAENASAIAPRAGSSTFLNVADDGNMVRQGAGALGDLARGRWGSLGMRIYDAWRTRGMSDQQVEQLVRIAVDPRQTDAAIASIAQRLAPQQRQEFLQLRQAALVGGVSVVSAGQRPD